MKTIREISALAGLPESTLRLYRDEFDDFVPCAGEGRRRRYTDEGAQTLQRIVAWKKEGWTTTRIRDALAREQAPRARARQRTHDERLDEVLVLLSAQASEIALLSAQVAALREDVRAMTASSRSAMSPRPLLFANVAGDPKES